MDLERLIARMREDGVLRSKSVEDALRSVPRRLFVPERYAGVAYVDEPLPIGDGQTISQPSTVVAMTEALDVRPGDSVLEIGAGSGWQAALLGHLAGPKGRVVTIERFEGLAKTAAANLRRAKIKNVEVRVGDGSVGVKGERFDRIIVTAAAPGVPKPLKEQLKANGRLVIPVGRYAQEMRVYVKKDKSLVELERSGTYVFVPLVGKYGLRKG